MPTFGPWRARLVREHDVVSLHLPQFERLGPRLARPRLGEASVLTYHCDLELPPGLFNRVVDKVVFGANYARRRTAAPTGSSPTRRTTPTTRGCCAGSSDKIDGDPATGGHAGAHPSESRSRSGRSTARRGGPSRVRRPVRRREGHRVSRGGDAALLERFPNLKVLFAGPYERRDRRGSVPAAARAPIDGAWATTGSSSARCVPRRFRPSTPRSTVLLVTSVNSTESFGLVQVEAMLCGTPVVASDLPGVRQPVRMTGMGEESCLLVTAQLERGILNVERKERYVRLTIGN